MRVEGPFDTTRNPAGAEPHILRYFTYDHLPAALANVSRPFAELARAMAANLPPSAELSAGLRKLLEAKDCMVRAQIAVLNP